MENAGGGAAPTGCYKCGRPGHWSRDCPSNPNANPSNNSNPSSTFTKTGSSTGGFGGQKPVQKAIEKPKKLPRSRPKLTPELLLSDDGLGYVLRHFPRAFKYRGRGHEVEQVGTTRRVKICLNGLREKVANGGDLTKLHETPVEHNTADKDGEAMNTADPWLVQEDASLQDHPSDVPEDMLEELYEQATEATAPALHVDRVSNHASSQHNSSSDFPNQAEKDKISEATRITEEQKARMEANRLKALEKAAARARAAKTA